MEKEVLLIGGPISKVQYLEWNCIILILKSIGA